MNRNELNKVINAYESNGIATYLDCSSLVSRDFAKDIEREMHNMGYKDASCACGRNSTDYVYGIYDQKRYNIREAEKYLSNLLD
jgi:hypothetical protein